MKQPLRMRTVKLILGSWGCVVFSNEPYVISNICKGKLENKFKGFFKEARFSVLDLSDNKKFIKLNINNCKVWIIIL